MWWGWMRGRLPCAALVALALLGGALPEGSAWGGVARASTGATSPERPGGTSFPRVRTPQGVPAVPRVAAHRGVHGDEAAEDSLEGLRLAAVADYIVEFDLRFTADGVPVAIHDATTTRTLTCAELRISDLTLDELRERCDIAGMPEGTEVPTWAEVVSAVVSASDDALMIVELKDRDLPEGAKERLLEPLLAAPEVVDRLVLNAFDGQTVLELVDHAERHGVRVLRTGLLFAEEQLSAHAITSGTGPGTIAAVPDRSLVTPEYVASLHAAGLQVWTWTANSPAEWRRLRAAGVDVIMSDRPDALWTFLASSQGVGVSWRPGALTFRFPAAPPGAIGWRVVVEAEERLVSPSATEYVREGLPVPGVYAWSVRAVNARVGGETLTGRTVLPAPPLPPERLAVRAVGRGSVKLSWTAPTPSASYPRDAFVVVYAGRTFSTKGASVTLPAKRGRSAVWSVQAAGPKKQVSAVVRGPERQVRVVP